MSAWVGYYWDFSDSVSWWWWLGLSPVIGQQSFYSILISGNHYREIFFTPFLLILFCYDALDSIKVAVLNALGNSVYYVTSQCIIVKYALRMWAYLWRIGILHSYLSLSSYFKMAEILIINADKLPLHHINNVEDQLDAKRTIYWYSNQRSRPPAGNNLGALHHLLYNTVLRNWGWAKNCPKHVELIGILINCYCCI